MQINPFDQPTSRRSKENTQRLPTIIANTQEYEEQPVLEEGG